MKNLAKNDLCLTDLINGYYNEEKKLFYIEIILDEPIIIIVTNLSIYEDKLPKST